MRNTLGLPLISLGIAGILIVLVLITHGIGSHPLNELEIGAAAFALGLLIFGIQGLISVLLEGEELHPGRVAPRLTNLLSVAIVSSSFVLLLVGFALTYGLTADWSPITLGLLAGAGCLILAFLLIGYKEAFLGDEASFDRRDDGVPW